MEKTGTKFFPLTKADCREDCALYLKDIGQVVPRGREMTEIGDVRPVYTGCAITVLATR